MPSLPNRVSWWLTAASAAWAGALLALEWPGLGLLGVGMAAWFGAATWLVTRWPWLGVLLNAGAVLALGLMGLPSENAAPLGPVLIALVTVGYLLSPRVSAWAVPVLLAATAASAHWHLPSVMFGLVLLLLPWWFGVLVRGRDARRRCAAEDARRLSLVDPSVHARQTAATEREEVAAAAFAVIGDAVRQMTETAAVARESLELTAIDAIHRSGEEATQRLRALLVLLREQPPVAIAPSGARPAAPQAAPPAVAALLGAAALLAIAAVTDLFEPDRDGLWAAIAAAALSWWAGRAGTRRTSLAWLVLSATVLALTTITAPDNLPIQIAMLVLPFGAAVAWSGQHAAAAVHLVEAQLRQAQIEAAERIAVSDERLHLSRDLHDAASHAVGTMMMQANAAGVLRERDPDGARTALDAVVDIGREATVELRAISNVPTRPGAPLSTSTHPSGPDDTMDLRHEVNRLVEAARSAGSSVTTDLDLRTDADPADVRLLLRVVREGLANAVRHAAGSEVTVEARLAGNLAVVRVTNGPARPDPRHHSAVLANIGSGLGLRGLRELVDQRHGELTARETGSGFLLCATLPARHAMTPAVGS
jgi:signal transduction histidine kinase